MSKKSMKAVRGIDAFVEPHWRINSGVEGFDMLEWFLKTYMPRTYTDTRHDRAVLRETLIRSLLDKDARIMFYKLIRMHMELQICMHGGRALKSYAQEAHARFDAALEVLHRKIERLYGSRALQISLRFRSGVPRLPDVAGYIDNATDLEIYPFGPYTYLSSLSSDLRGVLAAPASRVLIDRFLRRYRAEGWRYFGLHPEGLLVLVTSTNRLPEHRPGTHVLTAALHDLTTHLIAHATRPARAPGKPPSRLSGAEIARMVAQVFSAYFTYIGPNPSERWKPSGPALERQYRRVQKRSAAARAARNRRRNTDKTPRKN